jgi:hypothetical protein
MYKNILAWMTIWATTFNFVILPPSKANGMTAEEAVKLMGVVQDYIKGLNSVFGKGSQSAPSTPQPEVPTPKSGTENSQPTPDTTEVRSN